MKPLSKKQLSTIKGGSTIVNFDVDGSTQPEQG